jgi:hypothetical protein
MKSANRVGSAAGPKRPQSGMPKKQPKNLSDENASRKKSTKIMSNTKSSAMTKADSEESERQQDLALQSA